MQQRNDSAKQQVAESKGRQRIGPQILPTPNRRLTGARTGDLRARRQASSISPWHCWPLQAWHTGICPGSKRRSKLMAPSGPPPAPPVTVSTPLVETIQEWNDFTGQFEAEESVEIRARVSGYLESVNFDDGQLVQKGDLLFVIEPRPFEIALDSAKADVAQAEAQLELAKVQLERTAELRKKDFASAQAFDERAAEVKDATAALNKARADVDQAQLNLDYTRVLAPVSGRVGRHEVSVGNLVVGGTGAAGNNAPDDGRVA